MNLQVSIVSCLILFDSASCIFRVVQGTPKHELHWGLLVNPNSALLWAQAVQGPIRSSIVRGIIECCKALLYQEFRKGFLGSVRFSEGKIL